MREGGEIVQAFNFDPPDDLIKELASINPEEMAGAMLKKAAETVADKVRRGAMRAFKHDASRIIDCMVVTRTYDTPSDGGLNIKIGFTGYFTNSDGYITPAPLVVNVIEYGYSDGTRKHPFFRKCFKKTEITEAMKAAEEEYFNQRALGDALAEYNTKT